MLHAGRVALLVLAVSLAAAGCASTGGAMAPPSGAVPADFALDVTVLPAAAHAPEPTLRLVLLPDGSLRAGLDPQRRAGWLPQHTRVLDRQAIESLWSLGERLGLADADEAAAPVNFNLVQRPAEGRLYLVIFTGGGRRWCHVQADGAEAGGAGDVRRLVEAMAALAWTDLDPPPAAIVLPRRYDFGPDPYARYR